MIYGQYKQKRCSQPRLHNTVLASCHTQGSIGRPTKIHAKIKQGIQRAETNSFHT